MAAQHVSSHQQYSALATHDSTSTANSGSISRGPKPTKSQSQHTLWKESVGFALGNSITLAALGVGIIGAIGSFGFTFWLSKQIFYCPPWTTSCHVQHAVKWFTSRLGFVQGFVSSLYGICIAMIAYSTYQFAETTLWPALTQQPLTLEGIDSYLAHARGSLPSFPFAAWHARKPVSLAHSTTNRRP